VPASLFLHESGARGGASNGLTADDVSAPIAIQIDQVRN
jgi:hypothetical protein